MRTLIIYCHPSNRSYTYGILKQLQADLEAEGMEYEVSDLYAMNFQSDLTEAEYEREGYGNMDLPVPADVRAEHQKIARADCLVFIYPVWWSDCPAKLKGWFDRVYSLGYAYGYNGNTKIEKMKTVKYGLVICTAGHPNHFLQEIGIAESMRNVMLDDRLGKRFEKKEMIILGGTLDREKVKAEHAEILQSVSSRISALGTT